MLSIQLSKLPATNYAKIINYDTEYERTSLLV